MEHIRAYIAALNSAMDILAEAADASSADLTAAGMPDAAAEIITQLAQVYFGPTSFRRRQRRAVDGARRNRHSLPTLEVIEKHARRAPTQARAWSLRAELTHIACDTREMDRRARKKLREMRAPRDPKPGVSLRRRAAGKPWTLSITGPSALIAELHQHAGSLADVASFFRTGTSAATSTVRTNVVVPLDKLVGVAYGSDDVVLTMTNGAQITGAELAQRALAEEGFITLLHPVEGPVNLYRMRRGATWKQFMMAAAENPTCPVKGCHKPADECQVHHIFSWAGGGWTNAKNLTTACAYHNGRNDDHRIGPPRNGRFERTARGVRWVNPWDPPPPDLVETGPTT
ncbi:HNH endonuclease signature motif containing protein [Corynebacterium tuberculostearicum]|uniref:HNH endonuclease signature motif containing protein n=1 Tax=Corynebacterium tuberculostearicum TaxID=38304 RepID=A0AAE4SX77_9CORY|nr:HNH endonuclease signature motif containing protein [Corynebacterium tuberculostearicum]MDV2419151.1 HNH endonuclease signature motif containing protein [Corynebacterium tuberculostearicum]